MEIYINHITNEELEQKLEENTIVILDVRETEEYAQGHIPGSVLIPLGQLEKRCNELNKDQEIFIICKSGGRSNQACFILQENGFEDVYNVLPGMAGWTGPIDSNF
ncbi:rhodanese-like domain-containing protein [Pseudogracilibacillus sp. SE30717A]|uniref:rhodanese-like domain-containing protein n=1 Tax=Pseudogracilibacillus sp. SE30717A TaxID=3098293 RepID=UPI00300E6012